MPVLTGAIYFRGRINNLCFYKMGSDYYVRRVSSLTGKRVKTDPRFRLTLVYAGLLGRASRIGSVVYKALPKEFRRFWMYRAFTGEAMQLLKAGKTDEEAVIILSGIYVVPIRVAASKEEKIDPPLKKVKKRRPIPRRTLRIRQPLKEFYQTAAFRHLNKYDRSKGIVRQQTFPGRMGFTLDSS